MNRFKILALAVVAVTAVALTAAAGSASATVLCSQEESPCGAGNIYKASTKIEASLAPGTKVRFRVGIFQIECSSSTINAQTSSNGGEGVRVGASITAESFTSCGGASVIVNSDGIMEFEYVKGVLGTGKIYVLKPNSISLEAGGVKCTYGATASERWIMVNGSPNAPTYTMTDAETELVKTAGGAGCNATAKMNATYNISAPSALFVVEK